MEMFASRSPSALCETTWLAGHSSPRHVVGVGVVDGAVDRARRVCSMEGSSRASRASRRPDPRVPSRAMPRERR
jgi:hypothetical protein